MRSRRAEALILPGATPAISQLGIPVSFACSLNYLIGSRDERRRYGKPQLLGCLEVDGLRLWPQASSY